MRANACFFATYFFFGPHSGPERIVAQS